MNKILENEWFRVRYPINGFGVGFEKKKVSVPYTNVICIVCVTFGLHFILCFFALGGAGC